MPIEFQCVDNRLGVIAHCSGIIKFDDFLDGNEILYDPEGEYHDHIYQLVDCTNVESFDMSADEAALLTKEDEAAANENEFLFIAIVIPGDLGFGLGRVWHSYIDDISNEKKQFLIFRNLEDAKFWLRKVIKATATIDVPFE